MNNELETLSEKIKEPRHLKIRSINNLSAYNRLYLAVARKDISDKLVHVYTIGCPSSRNDSFYIKPTTDIATFTDKNTADMYVNKLQQIMQVQSHWPLHPIACNALKSDIDIFNQAMKTVCQDQKVK